MSVSPPSFLMKNFALIGFAAVTVIAIATLAAKYISSSKSTPTSPTASTSRPKKTNKPHQPVKKPKAPKNDPPKNVNQPSTSQTKSSSSSKKPTITSVTTSPVISEKAAKAIAAERDRNNQLDQSARANLKAATKALVQFTIAQNAQIKAIKKSFDLSLAKSVQSEIESKGKTLLEAFNASKQSLSERNLPIPQKSTSALSSYGQVIQEITQLIPMLEKHQSETTSALQLENETKAAIASLVDQLKAVQSAVSACLVFENGNVVQVSKDFNAAQAEFDKIVSPVSQTSKLYNNAIQLYNQVQGLIKKGSNFQNSKLTLLNTLSVNIANIVSNQKSQLESFSAVPFPSRKAQSQSLYKAFKNDLSEFESKLVDIDPLSSVEFQKSIQPQIASIKGNISAALTLVEESQNSYQLHKQSSAKIEKSLNSLDESLTALNNDFDALVSKYPVVSQIDLSYPASQCLTDCKSMVQVIESTIDSNLEKLNALSKEAKDNHVEKLENEKKFETVSQNLQQSFTSFKTKSTSTLSAIQVFASKMKSCLTMIHDFNEIDTEIVQTDIAEISSQWNQLVQNHQKTVESYESPTSFEQIHEIGKSLITKFLSSIALFQLLGKSKVEAISVTRHVIHQLEHLFPPSNDASYSSLLNAKANIALTKIADEITLFHDSFQTTVHALYQDYFTHNQRQLTKKVQPFLLPNNSDLQDHISAIKTEWSKFQNEMSILINQVEIVNKLLSKVDANFTSTEKFLVDINRFSYAQLEAQADSEIAFSQASLNKKLVVQEYQSVFASQISSIAQCITDLESQFSDLQSTDRSSPEKLSELIALTKSFSQSISSKTSPLKQSVIDAAADLKAVEVVVDFDFAAIDSFTSSVSNFLSELEQQQVYLNKKILIQSRLESTQHKILELCKATETNKANFESLDASQKALTLFNTSYAALETQLNSDKQEFQEFGQFDSSSITSSVASCLSSLSDSISKFQAISQKKQQSNLLISDCSAFIELKSKQLADLSKTFTSQTPEDSSSSIKSSIDVLKSLVEPLATLEKELADGFSKFDAQASTLDIKLDKSTILADSSSLHQQLLTSITSLSQKHKHILSVETSMNQLKTIVESIESKLSPIEIFAKEINDMDKNTSQQVKECINSIQSFQKSLSEIKLDEYLAVIDSLNKLNHSHGDTSQFPSRYSSVETLLSSSLQYVSKLFEQLDAKEQIESNFNSSVKQGSQLLKHYTETFNQNPHGTPTERLKVLQGLEKDIKSAYEPFMTSIQKHIESGRAYNLDLNSPVIKDLEVFYETTLVQEISKVNDQVEKQHKVAKTQEQLNASIAAAQNLLNESQKKKAEITPDTPLSDQHKILSSLLSTFSSKSGKVVSDLQFSLSKAKELGITDSSSELVDQVENFDNVLKSTVEELSSKVDNEVKCRALDDSILSQCKAVSAQISVFNSDIEKIPTLKLSDQLDAIKNLATQISDYSESIKSSFAKIEEKSSQLGYTLGSLDSQSNETTESSESTSTSISPQSSSLSSLDSCLQSVISLQSQVTATLVSVTEAETSIDSIIGEFQIIVDKIKTSFSTFEKYNIKNLLTISSLKNDIKTLDSQINFCDTTLPTLKTMVQDFSSQIKPHLAILTSLSLSTSKSDSFASTLLLLQGKLESFCNTQSTQKTLVQTQLEVIEPYLTSMDGYNEKYQKFINEKADMIKLAASEPLTEDMLKTLESFADSISISCQQYATWFESASKSFHDLSISHADVPCSIPNFESLVQEVSSLVNTCKTKFTTLDQINKATSNIDSLLKTTMTALDAHQTSFKAVSLICNTVDEFESSISSLKTLFSTIQTESKTFSTSFSDLVKICSSLGVSPSSDTCSPVFSKLLSEISSCTSQLESSFVTFKQLASLSTQIQAKSKQYNDLVSSIDVQIASIDNPTALILDSDPAVSISNILNLIKSETNSISILQSIDLADIINIEDEFKQLKIKIMVADEEATIPELSKSSATLKQIISDKISGFEAQIQSNKAKQIVCEGFATSISKAQVNLEALESIYANLDHNLDSLPLQDLEKLVASLKPKFTHHLAEIETIKTKLSTENDIAAQAGCPELDESLTPLFVKLGTKLTDYLVKLNSTIETKLEAETKNQQAIDSLTTAIDESKSQLAKAVSDASVDFLDSVLFAQVFSVEAPSETPNTTNSSSPINASLIASSTKAIETLKDQVAELEKSAHPKITNCIQQCSSLNIDYSKSGYQEVFSQFDSIPTQCDTMLKAIPGITALSTAQSSVTFIEEQLTTVNDQFHIVTKSPNKTPSQRLQLATGLHEKTVLTSIAAYVAECEISLKSIQATSTSPIPWVLSQNSSTVASLNETLAHLSSCQNQFKEFINELSSLQAKMNADYQNLNANYNGLMKDLLISFKKFKSCTPQEGIDLVDQLVADIPVKGKPFEDEADRIFAEFKAFGLSEPTKHPRQGLASIITRLKSKRESFETKLAENLDKQKAASIQQAVGSTGRGSLKVDQAESIQTMSAVWKGSKSESTETSTTPSHTSNETQTSSIWDNKTVLKPGSRKHRGKVFSVNQNLSNLLHQSPGENIESTEPDTTETTESSEPGTSEPGTTQPDTTQPEPDTTEPGTSESDTTQPESDTTEPEPDTTEKTETPDEVPTP